MKIKYQKQGCICLTDCPNLPPKQYKYKEVKTAVGSIECRKCKFFSGLDALELAVDCGFRRGDK